jgi:Fe-S-cluster containining protein
MGLPAGDTELVQIMDAALADAANRAGNWLACRPGCTQCCHGAFAINALDALRLRTGMETLLATDRSTAEAIKARAQSWIAEHGPSFPGDLTTGLLGTSDDDQARFEEFANDAPCPALNPATGLCDVYEWRPMTCRVFGPPVRMGAGDALGCCELCFVGASEAEIAACEMPPPHEMEERLLNELANEGNTGGAASAVEPRDTVVALALIS